MRCWSLCPGLHGPSPGLSALAWPTQHWLPNRCGVLHHVILSYEDLHICVHVTCHLPMDLWPPISGEAC